MATPNREAATPNAIGARHSLGDAALAEGATEMDGPFFRYTPLMFVHVMLAIVWSAVAHPFTSSVIDLATGEVHSKEPT